MKKALSIQFVAIFLLLCSSLGAAKTKKVKPQHITCRNRGSRCFLKNIKCPAECPTVQPKDRYAKACFLDCYSPKCEAVCRRRKPNCNGPGAACYDPRFIGGDGIVFYFHGRSNEHFALISDDNIQINARFVGIRPEGRTRDYTWIQALGLMFGPHNFTLEATKSEKWDNEVDHLKFSYNGQALTLPEGQSSDWTSPNNDLTVERTSTRNSVTVTIPEVVEVFASVVPVTEKDNLVHNYQIPENDCFAHLEVQFRFIGLSPKVEGILGRTYRPEFENPAKHGVEMPMVGGEDKYWTSSLLSSDCKFCLFTPGNNLSSKVYTAMEYGTVDCTRGTNNGYGIACRK